MASYEFSENQLIQMAQVEEQNLMRRKDAVMRLNSMAQEISACIDSLKELSTKSEKVFINLGAGVMVETQPKPITTCKTLFADNYFIDQPIDKMLITLEARKGALIEQATKEAQQAVATETRLTEMVNIIRQIQTEKSKRISKA
jgi:prefoldin subunit 5